MDEEIFGVCAFQRAHHTAYLDVNFTLQPDFNLIIDVSEASRRAFAPTFLSRRAKIVCATPFGASNLASDVKLAHHLLLFILSFGPQAPYSTSFLILRALPWASTRTCSSALLADACYKCPCQTCFEALQTHG